MNPPGDILPVCANARCGLHFTPKTKRSKYCSRVCTKRAYDKTVRPSHRAPKKKFFDLPFNSFDGEGETPNGDGSDRMTLLADSEGRELFHDDRRRLTTIECLQFLVDSPKKRANVWYAFGYDVANILYDLPREKLVYLFEHNRVWYKGFRIGWIPTKQFSVTWRAASCKCTQKQGEHKRRAANCEHVKSFMSHDAYGFFQSSFLNTMTGWYKTNDPQVMAIIERGKAARGDFATWNMADVIEYNRAELVVLNEIMANFREALRGANLRVAAWSGAGAIAAFWMKRERANQYFAMIPKEMERARDCAFFGGRIDAAVIGKTRASEGDLQSAYPAQVAALPDLSKLTWHLRKGKRVPEVGICHVKWNLPDGTRWAPFPYRERDGSAKYPLDGEGWYHAIEVRAALRRFPTIRVLESWEGRGEITHPFDASVRRDYALRATFKKAGNPAHVPLKLALNSTYGKFAQRAGVKVLPDGTIKKPTYHELIYAGMITAGTRARINDAIRVHGDENVLMIATDGVFVKGKWKIVEPDALGSWEVDVKTHSVTIAGAGMYETRDKTGKVHKNKRRGFGGSAIAYDDVIKQWRAGERVYIPTRRMVTLGIAAGSDEAYARRATFVDSKREMKALGSGPFDSKRFRNMYAPSFAGRLEVLTTGVRNDETACSAPYQILRKLDIKRDDRPEGFDD